MRSPDGESLRELGPPTAQALPPRHRILMHTTPPGPAARPPGRSCAARRHPGNGRSRRTTFCPQKAESGDHTFAGFPPGNLRRVVIATRQRWRIRTAPPLTGATGGCRVELRAPLATKPRGSLIPGRPVRAHGGPRYGGGSRAGVCSDGQVDRVLLKVVLWVVFSVVLGVVCRAAAWPPGCEVGQSAPMLGTNVERSPESCSNVSFRGRVSA